MGLELGVKIDLCCLLVCIYVVSQTNLYDGLNWSSRDPVC